MPLTALLAGFSLGLSLIVAIGAQNAFVLRQGLNREHLLAVCLVCAASDAVLILAGVIGFDWAATRIDWLERAARIGGAGFLFLYGARSLFLAVRADDGLHAANKPARSRAAVVWTCLAFTWLNPHVYLDTVVLLGSVSTQYAAQWHFAFGAMTASFAFFFALGYGAHLVAPHLRSATAWRVLDAAIALVMWAIALGLLL